MAEQHISPVVAVRILYICPNIDEACTKKLLEYALTTMNPHMTFFVVALADHTERKELGDNRHFDIILLCTSLLCPAMESLLMSLQIQSQSIPIYLMFYRTNASSLAVATVVTIAGYLQFPFSSVDLKRALSASLSRLCPPDATSEISCM